MKTILVVDDELEILEAIRSILEDEGYGVEVCRDGEDAIAVLRKGLSPDLILTDVMMPKVGGFDLLSFVRGGENKAMPVVLMSCVNPGVKKSDAHYDAFLRKPFKLEDLIETIKRYAG